MTYKDLMIGDWIRVVPFNNEKKSYIKTVENGNDLDNLFNFQGYIEPINVTPEILEKSGFKKYSKNTYKLNINGKKESIDIYFNEDNINLNIVNYNNEIKYLNTIKDFGYSRIYKNLYVHELQHALKICKINIDIKL